MTVSRLTENNGCHGNGDDGRSLDEVRGFHRFDPAFDSVFLLQSHHAPGGNFLQRPEASGTSVDRQEFALFAAGRVWELYDRKCVA